LFKSFWNAYPRRVGKGAALKAWGKIKEPKKTLQEIIVALEWQKKTEQWTKDGGQFIPHPATYINQCRWEDEQETVGAEPFVYVPMEELKRRALEKERIRDAG